jgi:hypothetical protein
MYAIYLWMNRVVSAFIRSYLCSSVLNVLFFNPYRYRRVIADFLAQSGG